MQRRTRMVVIGVIAVSLVVFAALAPYLFSHLLETHYLGIMNNLNKTSTKEAIRNNMTYAYNFTELFEWEHTYVKWVPMGEVFDRNTDPQKILDSGKGRCGEFSILYVSACLSLGYEARLLVSFRPYTYWELHNWVEVKVDGQWIPVDPTDKVWNNPQRYNDWWGEIGKDAFIFGFQNGKVEELTDNYR